MVSGVAAFLPYLCAISIFALYYLFSREELSVAKIFSVLAILSAVISPVRNIMFSKIYQSFADAGGGGLRSTRLLKAY